MRLIELVKKTPFFFQAGSSAPAPVASFNNNKIRFHERKGTLIKLSNNNRTAERRRPYDEFNNGVVMTHRWVLASTVHTLALQIMVMTRGQ